MTEQKKLWADGMNDQLSKALIEQFRKHRVVFWYDAEQQLRTEFDAIQLDGVEKVELRNNEFSLKYRILRTQPETKFLVYREGPQPADLENWLLDVQLAHGEFRTDQAALWLAELGLGYEFAEVVKQHTEFFESKKRREALGKLLDASDTPGQLRLKVLSVCAEADPRLDSILEALLDEHAAGTADKMKLIERVQLKGFLWEQAHKAYGYSSGSPGIHDFAIELFKSCYAMATHGDVRLDAEALVFLKRWKDSRKHQPSFEAISKQCADVLGIEEDLNHREYREVLELDYFELIDRKILSDLVTQVLKRTLTAGECTQFIRERRSGHWFPHFADVYEAVDHAAQFFQALEHAKVEIESLDQGLKAYTTSLFRVDQLYRKFIYHYRFSGQVTLLNELATEVRNHYTNSFLLTTSNRWQTKVDELESWQMPNTIPQHRFFDQWVTPYLNRKRKIFVVVSDALRYEVAEELARLIRSEDRYDAELKHVITKLPSYTQLGMAALLPNSCLEINPDKSATVSVDAASSQGTAKRNQLLNNAVRGKAMAIQAEEFLAKNRDECRELTREHDVIYVYQNRIDKVGHSRDTEKKVFIAVEEALNELLKLVKKLTAANANNILITADHGFIYQDEVVEDSDFSIAEPDGDIVFSDRRFILGRNLKEVAGLKKFTAGQLGLAGDLEVLVPKSINRFRKQGSATRFVHGGCTLQEIVVPVIEVNKRRTSDVSLVEVELLPGSSSVISSGQLAVAFYQTGPVTEKVQPRQLRVGIYAPSGDLISDLHELSFDLTSDNPRERELKLRLVLSKQADAFNQQQVTLRLDEPVLGTSHFKAYKSLAYTLRRSFTSDFDFA